MKKIIILLITTSILFAGCKKDQVQLLTYPKTTLIGCTFRGNPTTSTFGDTTYEFIKFNSSDSITITFADADGNNAASVQAACKINYGNGNIDSFEVDFAGGKAHEGFTTSDVNIITFDGSNFNRVKS